MNRCQCLEELTPGRAAGRASLCSLRGQRGRPPAALSPSLGWKWGVGAPLPSTPGPSCRVGTLASHRVLPEGRHLQGEPLAARLPHVLDQTPDFSHATYQLLDHGQTKTFLDLRVLTAGALQGCGGMKGGGRLERQHTARVADPRRTSTPSTSLRRFLQLMIP